MELGDWLEHTWSVAEDDLHVICIDDAHNAMTRGLRLAGNNTDALAHQGIHERTLADIGIADDVDETGFMHLVKY